MWRKRVVRGVEAAVRLLHQGESCGEGGGGGELACVRVTGYQGRC